MKNSQTKSSCRGAMHLSRAVLVTMLAAASTAWAAESVPGEEQAVVQAVSTIINTTAPRPYNFLYFESDFSTSPHVASSMSNPDRTDFCGLTRPQAQALVSELTTVTSKPVEFDNTVAKPAGLKVSHRKAPRFRYLYVSRVVFNANRQQAWLAVDQNGETGAVLRLDKVNGKWNKAARCGGWVSAG